MVAAVSPGAPSSFRIGLCARGPTHDRDNPLRLTIGFVHEVQAQLLHTYFSFEYFFRKSISRVIGIDKGERIWRPQVI
jgi:hypothetical protein